MLLFTIWKILLRVAVALISFVSGSAITSDDITTNLGGIVSIPVADGFDDFYNFSCSGFSKTKQRGVILLGSRTKPPRTKTPGHKPPGQKPPLPKTPWTKTPQTKHSFQKFYNFCF